MKKVKEKLSFEIYIQHDGYSSYCQYSGGSMLIAGATLVELKENIEGVVNDVFQEQGITYSLDEIELTYDVPSFFELYREINAKALAGRIGMNQSLLSQYVNGDKKPSAKQVARILTGIKSLGRELSNLDLGV
jgi:hypothetical protein